MGNGIQKKSALGRFFSPKKHTFPYGPRIKRLDHYYNEFETHDKKNWTKANSL
jgi:hypothetical protein